MTGPDDSREPLLLTMQEAADRLAVSRSKLYELARDGKVPGLIRIGTSLRVYRAKLEAWIAEASADAVR